MVKGSLIGQMVVVMLVNFKIIIFMERDTIHGLMEESMRGIGRKTKWKGKEYLHGWMEGNNTY